MGGVNPLMSLARLGAGFVFVALTIAGVFAWLVVLLPFGRRARILHVKPLWNWLGRGVLGLAGSRVTVHGAEHAVGPAIFANNHSSNLDAFLTIWLTPRGTVGLAKKEIVRYPFYGQAWLLAGHPTVDRGNSEKARASMRALGDWVRDHGFSVCMLPEGTRSRTGRLLPFKKGIVHLAVQTGLPIVPMVTVGAFGAWDKGSFRIQPRDIHVHFLPPVDTRGWSLDRIDEHLAELRARFLEVLPESMIDPADRPHAAA